MPLDRLFHAVAGHSEKVNRLTDLEFRVWTQYLLSADDFGVMRLAAAQIQADNDRLSEVSTRKVQRALEKLVEIDLLQTFQHQGKHFVYQWNWQKYQKVEYPRTTTMPRPSDVSACDFATQWLFSVHPGGKRLPKTSGEVAEQLPTTSGEVAALARAHAHPTANANGKRLEANGERQMAVVPMRGNGAMGRGYASASSVVYQHDRGITLNRGQFWDDLVRQFDGDPAMVHAWLDRLFNAQPQGWKCGDTFKFIRQSIDQHFAATGLKSKRTAALEKASQW